MAQAPPQQTSPAVEPSRRLRPRWLRRAAWCLAPVALLVAAYVFAVWPQSQVYGRVVTHGPSEGRMVALTFDDGPNDPATSRILDVLAAKDVHATFFLVGANAEVFPETVERMVAEGHAVGNHSYHHRKRDTLRELDYSELDRAEEAIRDAAGVSPAFYRSPNGFHTPWQLRAVRRHGMTTVHWDVQTKDWERPNPDTIVQRVLDHVHPGAIVLMHDGDDTIHGSDRTPTIEALPRLIDALREQGYRLVTVPELLGKPAYLSK